MQLMGRGWCTHAGSTLETDQEQRPASDHTPAGPLAGRTSCDGSWDAAFWKALASVMSLGTHGNAGPWVIFSPLATPAPVQKAGAALAPAPVVHPKEPDAPPGGCLPPVVMPPPAAAPTAAQELGLACTASHN